jgi:hypothetical protein
MSIKITIPNTSSDVLTFGSANTPTAAQIAGIDSGSSNGQLALYTTASGTSTERVRVDASGNVGIGTSSPSIADFNANSAVLQGNKSDTNGFFFKATSSNASFILGAGNAVAYVATTTSSPIIFQTNTTERMRIDTSGNLLVGKTSDTFSAVGGRISPTGVMTLTADSNELANFNRLTNDGALLYFSQASTIEGSISVSGTTVSYNGGHLARYAQTVGAKDEALVKGTVLSNLDEMNSYTDTEGNPVENEQLNKVKVSNVEGDANVAGVFVNWTHDDAHNVDEINMAMTGDMIIRIAQGVTVQRGDLLMSAGDGTAKPQGDDIVRSKTIAKVTSTHVTCTYADGSFCVPCVLMAC